MLATSNEEKVDLDVPGNVAFPQKPEVLKTKPKEKQKKKTIVLSKTVLQEEVKEEEIKLCWTRTILNADKQQA